MMENISEVTNCKSVFAHTEEEEISEAFTNLWAKVINKKENHQLYILQTDHYNKS